MLIWLILVFMASRYCMFSDFADPQVLGGYEADLGRMWWMGLRYDARVSAIMLLLPLGVGLFFYLFSGLGRFTRRFILLLFILAAFTAALFAIANYYYYQTYHNFIDIFAFGFFAEDQAAVLGNIWDDYPVVRIGLLLLGLSLAPLFPAVWLLGKTNHAERGLRFYRKPKSRPMLALFYLIISGALFFLIARGSVSTFPLGRNDANISSLTIINKLTPNGLITFKWAWEDYADDIVFETPDASIGHELLKKTGLNLLEKTPDNAWLAANPPHVLLVLMESFGSNMLALDVPPQNDLLGSLRQHLAADFLFRRFLPEGNGTAPSLAALFFLSPAQNISHSSAQNSSLGYTPFDTYKKAGYSTVFIYPGNMMWRNMANFLPLQGVDKFYDQNDLLRLYPEAQREITAWGVPDEYAYRLAAKLLEEAGQPLFIGLLTTSNHPPYRVPSHYTPGPVALTPEVEAHSEDGGIEQTEIMHTFQYAANAFGDFLSGLKASAAGSKTLVAATGDHQMRRLKSFEPMEQALNLGVPLYLYVPEEIKSQTPLRFDETRPGSHKDILPTLYALSLSNAEYLALGGRNLLAEKDDPSRAFGYNERIWIDSNGAYFAGSPQLLHRWAMPLRPYEGHFGTEGLLLGKNSVPTNEPELTEKIRAYPKLLRWQINARVSGQRF